MVFNLSVRNIQRIPYCHSERSEESSSICIDACFSGVEDPSLPLRMTILLFIFKALNPSL